ncbi:MAG: CHAT domain-containing protein [Alphaproteobacteria bacterium]|nr:CHAT domain-containing protein [Alphaproteobacteria bacterium]MCW5742428.1 CHAT domain-containing protein [Alphaproteobacteria bacterium]
MTSVVRFLTVAALGGLASMLAGATGAQAPQGTPAGQSAAGEPCVFRPAAPDAGIGAQATYEILCGKTRVFSATVHQMPGTTGAEGLRALATTGRWKATLEGRARCEAPRQTTLGGNPAIVVPCTRAGGVPHVGVLTTAGGKTFLADGIAPAAPAIEATVAALGGGQPAAAAARGGGTITGGLDARFKGGFGSGDIDRYQTLMRVGGRHNIEENYAKAEESFREALVLHQKLFGRDNPDQADALIHFALQISNQGRFREADPLFERAEKLAGGVKDPLARARIVHYSGQHLANQGKRNEAVRNIDLAEAAYVAAAPELARLMNLEQDRRAPAIGFGVRGQRFVDPRSTTSAVPSNIGISPITQLAAQGMSEILRLRAILALTTGDNNASRAHANKAIALLEAVGIDPGGVRWRAVRVAGLGAARQDKLGTASADLGDSARGLSKALPSSQPAGKTFLESGNIQLKRGNVPGALSEFRRGAAILRERQNTVSVETAMPYLDAAWRRSQSAVTATGVSLHAEMFDAAQLVTSGITASFVAQAALRLGDGNENVRVLQDLTTRVTDLYQRRDIAANRNADAATLAAIDAQIGDVQQQRAAAEEEVRKTLPNYFQLVEGQAGSRDVLGVLRPQEGFLHIVLGATRGYAMLAHSGRVNAWPVNLNLETAEEIVGKLRGAFTPDAQGQLPKYDVALSHDLFKRVLGPGQHHLKTLKALVITTNGALQSLPFNLLVTAPPPAIEEYTDYKKVEWLAKWFAMSYVPAPQSLVLLRKQAAQSKAPSAYVGFGGFQPLSIGAASQLVAASRAQSLTAGQRCDADARELASLPVLPLAEGEVQLTAKQLGVGPGGMHLGRAFSKTSVLKGQLERYKIIHLAAHALLPSELRCLQQPVILTGQGTGPEAMITAADLAALRLDADMVVLSACNTAGPDGKSAGEAFSGLARSFFTAGTRGLMASHWSVADESTTLMMINVLVTVGKGGSAAAVLRTAQLEMLDGAGKGQDPAEWAHPFFWAPFVFAGNTGAPQS